MTELLWLVSALLVGLGVAEVILSIRESRREGKRHG